MNIPIKIIVHHSAAPNTQTLAAIDAYHKSLGFTKSAYGWYIGYHYVIEASGKLTQTRLDEEDGCHTIGQNTSSLGVCLLGDFDKDLPTASQIVTLKDLLRKKTEWYNIPDSEIYPHRKFATRSCYGSRLPDNWASLLCKISKLEALLLQLKSLLEALLLQLKSSLPK